jgi:hypothetical protein
MKSKLIIFSVIMCLVFIGGMVVSRVTSAQIARKETPATATGTYAGQAQDVGEGIVRSNKSTPSTVGGSYAGHTQDVGRGIVQSNKGTPATATGSYGGKAQDVAVE